MALPHKDRSDARTPDFFDGGQDAQFVIDQHIMFGGIALFDIWQFIFLVHVNQHFAFDRFEQPGTVHLARLKNDIAIR